MLFMVGIFSAEAIQSFAFFNYPFNTVVFIVGGGVCHSCPGFRLPSYNACVVALQDTCRYRCRYTTCSSVVFLKKNLLKECRL